MNFEENNNNNIINSEQLLSVYYRSDSLPSNLHALPHLISTDNELWQQEATCPGQRQKLV